MFEQTSRRWLMSVGFLLFAISAFSQLEIAKIFSDHMVIQRNQEVIIWGWSSAQEKITGTLDQEVKATTATPGGKWEIRFSARPAGGPITLKIETENEKISLTDILIGDVWVCSGQSNMEWLIENSSNLEETMREATDSQIRHFKVPRSFSEQPDEVLAGGQWVVCHPESVASFTAVGYHFAKNLRASEGVPIGLLNSSWGGSRIEPWMSEEILDKMGYPNARAESMTAFKQRVQERLAALKKQFPGISEEDRGIINGDTIWASQHIPTSDWVSIDHTKLWESNGFEGLDGIGWYRTQFDLSTKEVYNPVTISIGKIDDSDITWVNGHRVGEMDMAWSTQRIYDVPIKYLNAGKNTIVVRCEDTGGGGGIYGTPDLFYYEANKQKKPFPNPWKFNVGAVQANANTLGTNQIPTLLYNKMIHPLLQFPIKGVIWYQGESNAGSVTDATKYANLFKHMIIDWRNRWDVGDFPFLYVQLANFMSPDAEPAESNWALLRESQTKTLELSNTGQAVIIDIGEADDIHPRNKHDVGYRLALAAQKIAYGKNVVYSGPKYQSHSIQRNLVYISFDHIGSGLKCSDTFQHVNGFAIAEADGKFKWAQARIQGDQVMVWHEDIARPVSIRYAWGNNPDTANLFNAEGLPACPFRVE